MEFFIRKESTDPILKMQLVLDGRNDFQDFHTKLANSTIYFSMRDVDTGVLRVVNRRGGIVSKTSTSINAPTEYYVYYKWADSDVRAEGRFEGQFAIYFHGDNTKLIAPIRENLYITISDSFVKLPC
tara:strand:- start:463 stop:843 length:381 start_codon:yes stop_codon:yes gene_type:complete